MSVVLLRRKLFLSRARVNRFLIGIKGLEQGSEAPKNHPEEPPGEHFANFLNGLLDVYTSTANFSCETRRASTNAACSASPLSSHARFDAVREFQDAENPQRADSKTGLSGSTTKAKRPEKYFHERAEFCLRTPAEGRLATLPPHLRQHGTGRISAVNAHRIRRARKSHLRVREVRHRRSAKRVKHCPQPMRRHRTMPAA
jgi:hypothetical protein